MTMSQVELARLSRLFSFDVQGKILRYLVDKFVKLPFRVLPVFTQCLDLPGTIKESVLHTHTHTHVTHTNTTRTTVGSKKFLFPFMGLNGDVL